MRGYECFDGPHLKGEGTGKGVEVQGVATSRATCIT